MNDTLTVCFEGKLNFDATAGLRDKISTALITNPKILVLNLEKAHFIDASGLGLLLATQTQIKKQNGEFRLSGVSRRLKEIFERTQLVSFFIFEANL